MMNGKQIGDQNVKTFLSWIESKSDSEFREMSIRGVLSRKDIAKECAFSKSVLAQNPEVRKALKELEDGLRRRGILPSIIEREDEIPLKREPGRQHALIDAERLRRLEQENAALRAEVSELKRALERHAVLREALALTGRLPR